MSLFLKAEMLRSNSIFFHEAGSMADMVMRPSGCTAAFLEINRKACLKLQNESGYFGNMSRMFILFNLNGRNKFKGVANEWLWPMYFPIWIDVIGKSQTRKNTEMVLYFHLFCR